MHKQNIYVTLTAVSLSLIFIITYFVKIPNGFSGYINVGDAFIILFSCILPPYFAFLAAGLGSGLADIVGGFGIYFFFTFIIKGFEGYFIAQFKQHLAIKNKRYIIFAIALVIMLIGYFITDTIINQSWYLALIALSINLIQAVFSFAIASFLYPWVTKYYHAN